MDVTDKLVLITGAARGIGEAIAVKLAGQGARLILTDINGEGVTAAAARIPGATGYACDISSDSDVARLRAIVETPDILINNAAAQQFGPGGIDDLDLARWQASFDVNVLGSVRMAHAFLPAMKARGSGHIVNTSSSLAIRPNAVVQHLMPYVTSKGALLTFTYALAYALAGTGVGVSLFCPGLTTTRPDGATKPTSNGWMQHTPPDQARPGSMQDAADIFAAGLAGGQFLISSDSGYAAAIVAFAEAGLDPFSNYQQVPA